MAGNDASNASLATREFRALLEAVPDAMVVVGRDGRILMVNGHAERLFGFVEAELTGSPVERLVPDQLADSHARERRRYFEQPAVRSMGERPDLVARHRDGTEFPVEIRLSPVELGGESLAIASIRDVTAIRRVQAQQRWQTEFSEGLIDSLPGIFYLISSDGCLRQWNANLEEITGYGAEEIRGMHPVEFFDKADGAAVSETMNRVFEHGLATMDLPLRAKDGSKRDFHFIGHRISLGGEQYLTGVGIDTTEVRHTEHTLEYVSGLQRMLVESSKRFIASRSADIDDLITEVLGRVGAYCDVDRSYLFRFKEDRALMDNTHEWCAPGVTPEIDNLQDLPREAVPRVVELMERREVMHVPRVADLPPDWENDKAVFEEEDIQSLIVVPIVVGEELHGFIGFDSVSRERAWSEAEIRLLEVLADLFGAVIHRETAARALSDSEALRSHAERLAHLGSWEWDLDRNRFRASREWRRVTGCRADPLTRDDVLQIAHPDDLDDIRAHLAQTLEKGVPFSLEHRIRRADNGELRWIRVHAELDGESGEARRLYGFIQDITERKRIEAAVADSEARYRSVVNNIREVVFQSDEAGRWTFLNPAWAEVTGFAVADSLGRPFLEFVHPGDRDVARQEFQALMTGGMTETRNEARYLTPDGGYRWVEINVRANTNEAGHITGCSGTMRDVTEQREAERKMRQLAHYDPVTHLPNRILALDRLDQLLKASKRTGEQVALLFLDLDHFKKANDTLGHEAGDELLREAAQRLLQDIREHDTVARFGGDEFLVLVGGLRTPADAQPVAEKLLESFREPFLIQGRELTLTASLGIAIAPADGTDSRDLLRNADMAMYQSKEEGRNTHHYFTEAMNREMERRLAIEEQLRGAQDRGELRLVYQPMVDLADDIIVGAEALVRWRNPALGDVPPEEFIPIAEQTGLIDSIGHFVLTTALAQAAEWRRQGRPGFWVAVNVSPQQFRDSRLVEHIGEALRDAGLPGDALQVELTESVLLSGRTQAGEALARLKTLGVDIAMDDFGTGYASLSYLRQFPFDTLKIDRSFVGDITDDPRDCELVVASLALAHSLGLRVVGEGVETEPQLALLRQHGCQLAQGHLFGEAMDAETFSRSLGS